MYLNETLIIFVIGLLLFIIFLLLLTFFIANYRNSSQREERLKSLAITQVQRFNDGSGTQSVNMQRVLRARLSEMKKLEKGGYRTKISNLLLRSGSKYSFKSYVINSLLIFILSFVLIFLLSNTIYALIFSLILGAFGQNFYLSTKATRRQKQFTADFANALDIIVRGVTVGLSINESMKTVAYEAQGPVSEEFRRIVDSQAMGIEFDDVLEEAINRMPTPEFRFFSIVMQIQRQTGGSMSKTLADLSSLLRGRKEMRDKITALSSEAKSSAMIIGCLPLFITGLLYVMSPDFLDPLLDNTIGNIMIGGAIGLMLVGILVMRAMINFKF
jgi:tight adherence protein B